MQTKDVINLFEYSNQEAFDGDSNTLEELLDFIWKNRPSSLNTNLDDDWLNEKLDSSQKFLKINRNKTIKSKNYVGMIKIGKTVINFLPKIFYDKTQSPNSHSVEAIHANILWWLSYCRKFKFPKSKTSLNMIKADFFEVLIYMFASHTKNILSKMIARHYEEVSNNLSFLKGRINMDIHIKENLTTGNWQRIACTYDSFEIDNTLNRLIKYVSTLLRGASKNPGGHLKFPQLWPGQNPPSDATRRCLDITRLPGLWQDGTTLLLGASFFPRT